MQKYLGVFRGFKGHILSPKLTLSQKMLFLQCCDQSHYALDSLRPNNVYFSGRLRQKLCNKLDKLVTWQPLPWDVFIHPWDNQMAKDITWHHGLVTWVTLLVHVNMLCWSSFTFHNFGYYSIKAFRRIGRPPTRQVRWRKGNDRERWYGLTHHVARVLRPASVRDFWRRSTSIFQRVPSCTRYSIAAL